IRRRPSCAEVPSILDRPVGVRLLTRRAAPPYRPRMSSRLPLVFVSVLLAAAGSASAQPAADATPAAPRAFIDGTGPGWRTLGPDDFAPVNGYPDTWTWKGDLLTSTGVPIGVMRTRDIFTNFELVIEWRHLKPAGNSGVFAWVPMKALDNLPPD